MSELTKLWNGHAGHAWVEHQPVLDRMFEPFTQMLVEEADAKCVLEACMSLKQ